MIKKIIKSNKSLFFMALKFKENKLKPREKIEEPLNNYLQTLYKDGVVVIPDFFTEEECKNMIDAYESIDKKYVKYYENDKRIFGIEKISPIHKRLFHDNNDFKKIGEAYLGDDLVLQTTMAAKITTDNNQKFGSGGSWHRDSFSRQFKAIAYLSDVEMSNGPFMYIKGSHTLKNIKKVLFKLRNHKPISSFRYNDDEIKECCKILDSEISYFTAPKGTLILADIRGLHTGMSIEEGHRYAVFNYYIAKSFHQTNNNIEKLANY
ncbi:phytanoyl-CoA dioxygenase family protein [Arcobacter roscoffensis]|uniref:Phytanoyl-CoA dioxygenase family protein n=1 Tax=Arcobacter roscoffensis TaxID=2961520 RepID=A0ABY5E757_9BACT|nr:phytanoyl-CoA dioxygenase family protein [Arcobacter roscoffensis]UTJ07344.1 phytanoyl-CoA dioxygenase family protein [Arcobacter roscoffensis]